MGAQSEMSGCFASMAKVNIDSEPWSLRSPRQEYPSTCVVIALPETRAEEDDDNDDGDDGGDDSGLTAGEVWRSCFRGRCRASDDNPSVLSDEIRSLLRGESGGALAVNGLDEHCE